MIPQISDQVLSHGWMTAEQVTDIVAIAELVKKYNLYRRKQEPVCDSLFSLREFRPVQRLPYVPEQVRLWRL